VERRHQETYAHHGVFAIRRKCNNLHRIQVPTGDPNCFDEVKNAKRIKYRIRQRASLGGGDEDFDLEAGVFTGIGVFGPPPPEIALGNIARNAIPPPDDNNPDGAENILVSSSHFRVSPGTLASNRRSRSTNSSNSFLEMMRLQIINDVQQRRDDKEKLAEL